MKRRKPSASKKSGPAPVGTPDPPAPTKHAPEGSILHAIIALRAYERHLERGCRVGHDLDDWLEAEREILGLSIPDGCLR